MQDTEKNKYANFLYKKIVFFFSLHNNNEIHTKEKGVQKMGELKQIKFQNPSDRVNEDTYIEKDNVEVIKDEKKEKKEKGSEQIPEIEAF